MSDLSLVERIAAGEKITRAEAESHIRSVRRWCRGIPVHTSAEMKGLQEVYDSGGDAERLKLKQDLEAKYKLADKPVANAAELHSRIMDLIYAYPDSIHQHRLVCGQDMNDLMIADGHYDGETHAVQCPKCKQPLNYRVLYNLTDEG